MALIVVPPFHGNPLRPFRDSHVMQHMPPAKPYRWAIRHFGDHLDRLGSLEQAQRPRQSEAFLLDRRNGGILARGLRRDRGYRIVGNMGVLRHQPRKAARPKASAQTINQMRELGLGVRSDQAALRWLERLRNQRRQPDHVVTKAGIALVANHRQSLDEKPLDAFGIAQRLSGSYLQSINLAIGAEQHGLQQPRALAAPLQDMPKFARELSKGTEYVRFEHNWIRKTALRHVAGQWQARPNRFIFAP